MNDKELADIVCRALLAIVSAIRKRYDLPVYHGVTVVLQSEQTTITPQMDYSQSVISAIIPKTEQ